MRSPSDDGDPQPDLTGVLRERDLYRALLELGSKDEVEPFLEEALALAVEAAGARRGYLELRDERAGTEEACFWIARGCSDDDIAFSRGVIAEAIATRQTIVTASAVADPRFRERGSVQHNRIEAVICAPIGVDPPLGVLYLQDRRERGAFREDDRLRTEACARYLAAFAERVLARRRRRDENDLTRALRRALPAEGIIGRSAALARVLEQVAQVAPHDITVLLTGSPGTGKTRVARLIHESGPRRAEAFVEINCAALPETLMESELFGAEKGAHSTATRKIEGKVAAARGGTLFLDEIGELRPPAQAKLLQLVQSKEYYPLGATRPVAADVRIIAATNADLKAAVSRREFREDLLHRLQVMPIRFPALAERREDIADLAAHFCDRAAEANKVARPAISPAALRALEVADWPGNARELQNVVTAAVLRASWEHVSQIEPRHFFPDAPAAEAGGRVRQTYQQAIRSAQERVVREALEEAGWNVAEAAKLLDVTRAHVYNMIHAFGFSPQKDRAR